MLRNVHEMTLREHESRASPVARQRPRLRQFRNRPRSRRRSARAVAPKSPALPRQEEPALARFQQTPTAAPDESEKLDGLLLGQRISHQRAAQLTAGLGVMQPSAIGAGDDCCDRGRSRSSRALWRRAARQAAPGADDGSPTGCDSRAHGVAVTVGGPEFGPPYDGRLLTDDRGLAASRLPDGRNGRSVAATLAAPVHRRSSASPRSYVNGIDARTLRRRRRPRRPPPSSRTDR